MRAFALPHNPRLACTRQAQLEPGRQAWPLVVGLPPPPPISP